MSQTVTPVMFTSHRIVTRGVTYDFVRSVTLSFISHKRHDYTAWWFTIWCGLLCFRADIALIGLAVMGQNIILNMNDRGFVVSLNWSSRNNLIFRIVKLACDNNLKVCAYNRTVEKVDRFLANEAKGTNIIGAKSLEDMVKKLKKPRRVMMLVKAGSAVDDFIKQLVSPLPSTLPPLTLNQYLSSWRFSFSGASFRSRWYYHRRWQLRIHRF